MQVFRIIIIRNIKIIQILFKIKKFNHLFLLYFIFAFFQIHLRIILFFPFSQQNQCLLLLCKCNAHVLLDFIFSKNCINYFIKCFYFSFYIFFIRNRLTMKFMPNIFLILFQISSCFTNTLSFSISKDIFFHHYQNIYVSVNLRQNDA